MVDLESPVPLYVQLADILRAQIRDGTLVSKVPSIRTLAQAYGIANVTAARALELLRDEGLIVSAKGKGYYVAR
jgi:DNA-binding GntR family transcriptional regulator